MKRILAHPHTIKFSRFTRTAVMSMGLDYLVFTVFMFAGLHVMAAQTLARLSGGVFSFLMNRNWTFAEHKKHLSVTDQGLRFLALYVVSFSLSLFLLKSFLSLNLANEYVCKIAADFLCFVFNYAIMHSVVFAKSRKAREEEI